MMQFFDIADGFAAVRQAVFRAVSKGNVVIALTMTVLFGVCAAGLAPLVWAFDINPTIQFGTRFAEYINGTGWAEINPVMAGYTIALLTVLPTALELLLPMLAREWRMATIIFYSLLAFDAFTDSTAIDSAFAPYQPDGGIWWLVWWLLHYPALLLATIGLEFLFLCCLLGTAMSLLSVVLANGSGRRRTSVDAEGM